MSRHDPTPGGMHFVYRFTIHRPGRSEPHVVDVQSFAAGADLKRMLDDRGWTYEITGREPEFSRLEA